MKSRLNKRLSFKCRCHLRELPDYLNTLLRCRGFARIGGLFLLGHLHNSNFSILCGH